MEACPRREADLYGQHVAVDFVQRVRGMEKFDSVEALIEEMGRDAEKARAILAEAAIVTARVAW